jgi:hypothetical protein
MKSDVQEKAFQADASVTTSSTPSETAGSILDDLPPATGHQYGSVEPHVFTSSGRADYWRNIYENAKYECRHRFDPSFQWSHQGEVIVKRKVIHIA